MADAKYIPCLTQVLAVAFGVTLALAAPVWAQSPNCKVQWTKLVDTLQNAGLSDMPSATLVRSLADGQCRVGALTIPVDSETTVTVNSVTWGGEDIARFVVDGLPPRVLNIAVKGLKLKPSAGKAGFRKTENRHLSTLSGDVSLAASWDEDARVLTVDRLSLRLPQGDYFVLQATAQNVDLSKKASMQLSLGSFLISNAQIAFATVGTFAPYAEARLGRDVWGYSLDPAERVAEVEAKIDPLPDTLINQASKTALKTLILDMPKVAGEARIMLNAAPGLGPLQYLQFHRAMRQSGTLEAFWATLTDVHVDVIYPTP